MKLKTHEIPEWLANRKFTKLDEEQLNIWRQNIANWKRMLTTSLTDADRFSFERKIKGLEIRLQIDAELKDELKDEG